MILDNIFLVVESVLCFILTGIIVYDLFSQKNIFIKILWIIFAFLYMFFGAFVLLKIMF
jgi:hypothetical protein